MKKCINSSNLPNETNLSHESKVNYLSNKTKCISMNLEYKEVRYKKKAKAF